MDKLISQYDRKPFEGGDLNELIGDENLDDAISSHSFGLNKVVKGVTDFIKHVRDHEMENDPFVELGFGYMAYFNMLYKFSLMFLGFTFLMIPVLGIYIYNGALNG